MSITGSATNDRVRRRNRPHGAPGLSARRNRHHALKALNLSDIIGPIVFGLIVVVGTAGLVGLLVMDSIVQGALKGKPNEPPR